MVQESVESYNGTLLFVCCKLITLLGIITVGLLTTRKNKNLEKYGEIAPPVTLSRSEFDQWQTFQF